MKKRITVVLLIGIGFAAGFATRYVLTDTLRRPVAPPAQATVTSSLTSPPLVAASTNGEDGQHRFTAGVSYHTDDSFVRYFGQEGLTQYQKAMAEFTRTGGAGTFHFVFHDPVVREYRPSDPREQMELMRHRSLHLIDTRHQPSVDLMDPK